MRINVQNGFMVQCWVLRNCVQFFFFKVSKWNVIIVGGYEHGKNLVLKKKVVVIFIAPSLMDGHVYGCTHPVYPSTCWVSSQNRNVG
jgi:hypothetical protein